MLGPARGALHEEPNAVILHVGVCEGRGPRGYGEPTRARSRKRRIQPRGYLRPRLALSYSERGPRVPLACGIRPWCSRCCMTLISRSRTTSVTLLEGRSRVASAKLVSN